MHVAFDGIVSYGKKAFGVSDWLRTKDRPNATPPDASISIVNDLEKSSKATSGGVEAIVMLNFLYPGFRISPL